MLFDQFKEMCRQPENGKAYYRPLICNGNLSDVDVFFVGTNPATLIFPEELDLDNYVELLLDYEKFIDYYKKRRLKEGKNQLSRTRSGMNSFFNWLSKETDMVIGETEVIPYPTPKLKDLRKEPKYIRDRGLDIFHSLICQFTPRLLILHGKKTVEWTNEILTERGLISSGVINNDESIEQMETCSPLVQFKYPNGKIGTVLACRHFMYYGNTGDSFKEFRNNVLSVLREPIV